MCRRITSFDIQESTSKEQCGVWGDTQDFGLKHRADEIQEEKQVGGGEIIHLI